MSSDGETGDGKELIRVALVFNAEQRRFSAWKVLNEAN